MVGGVGLEDKLIRSDGDGADHNLVEDLVEGGVLGGTDVGDLPLDVVGEGLEALEGYFELERVLEGRGIVQDDHADDVDLR